MRGLRALLLLADCINRSAKVGSIESPVLALSLEAQLTGSTVPRGKLVASLVRCCQFRLRHSIVFSLSLERLLCAVAVHRDANLDYPDQLEGKRGPCCNLARGSDVLHEQGF